MKKIIERVNYSLNNENAGPNLEHLLGMAVSLLVTGGIVVVKEGAYSFLKLMKSEQASIYSQYER